MRDATSAIGWSPRASATRAAPAQLPAGSEVEHVRAAALDSLRAQARLQLASEQGGVIAWELIEPDADAPHRGLAALPAPAPEDIFFDMEGDQFAGPEGREYLFGWVEGDVRVRRPRALGT